MTLTRPSASSILTTLSAPGKETGTSPAIRKQRMRTEIARKEDYQTNRRWYHVDATDKVLGRLSARIAMVLMGKDRPQYTPHVDTGAYVVVTNAEKVRLTGRKMAQKTYSRYSGYPGGLKVIPIREQLDKHPERILRESVRRMLPKSKLGVAMLRKLKVYAGPKHPHTYHKPEPLVL
jgi:large subunit ribosomal protein L13